MIIGISGKKGNGKDTIASIIQYLTANIDKSNYDSFEQYIGTSSRYNQKPLKDWTWEERLNDKFFLQELGASSFKIKRFADKLKDIVCILIGCTREQLEDREFKEKELGEEWWYWKLQVPNANLDRDNKITIDMMFNSESEAWEYNKNLSYNPSVCNVYQVKPTPRLLLQLLGTDCGRNIIHPNIWVNALFNEYKESKPPIHSGKFTDENCYMHSNCSNCGGVFYGYKRQFVCKECHNKISWFPNWVIPDVRFPNEAQAIKERGGLLIRVNRYTGHPLIDNDTHVITDWQHPSETALDHYKFRYTIDNDSSIESMIEKVKNILIKEKIIINNN